MFDDYFNIYIDILDKQDTVTLKEAQEHLNIAKDKFAQQTDCSTKKLHESGVFSCDSMASMSERWKATRFCEFKLKNSNMILVDTYNFHHY